MKAIQSLLVCQHRDLRDQHVDVRVDAGIVSRLFEFEKGLSRVHRLLLLLNFLG